MNREIKFRAIREVYNPQWHDSIFTFGNLLNHNSIGEVGCDLEHYQYSKVKPETIGQMTEFKDKHGKVIYEGDILKLSNTEKVCVSFENGSFVGIRKNKTISHSERYWKHSEILGNIHQNPELLQP